ncbi:YaaR family protein [Leptospira kanakyensis]|uniref:YaaR family protein n=1 Tax=Leptospira kanakyensis TaxID=2484968 RepID=UPI00223C8D99|nr:YaaR family protein [Leptospira kanakyensis]MCW7480125.1 YaaR family protein [Leptospira kanakyensis]
MIIQNNNPKSVSTQAKKGSKEKLSGSFAPVDESKQSFLEILESIVPSGKEETRELNELWKDLPDLEKELIKDPNHRNLESYKKHIKQIAELILKKNYKVMQAPQRGRNDQKDVRYVKVVDEKLDLLAKTMFSPNNSAFVILKQLDEIRGLLIDLKG